MALIKCPNCGGTISDQAPQCPHCNKPFAGDAINHTQQAQPAPQEVMYAPPRPKPTPQPTAKSAGSRTLLYVVIALLFAAACGVGAYIFFDRKHKSDAADKTAAAATFAAEAEAVETDDWDDDPGCEISVCEIYDPIPNGAEHLYGNVYTVSTDAWLDECEGWIKPYLEDGTGRAAVFADRIWLRSSMSTDSDSNKLALLDYGTQLDVVSQPSDKWVEVSVSSGEYQYRRGYVSAGFVIDAQKFEIMDRSLTSDARSRENLSTAKWRRALTDALIKSNWQYCPGQLTVTRPYTIDVSPRQLTAFRIYDPSDDTCFIAYIEFYESDEEYRIVGMTYDCAIQNINCTSVGTYQLTLDFSRSLN